MSKYTVSEAEAEYVQLMVDRLSTMSETDRKNAVANVGFSIGQQLRALAIVLGPMDAARACEVGATRIAEFAPQLQLMHNTFKDMMNMRLEAYSGDVS